MKKFLFTMFALLSVMAINAQNWTGPSGNDYPTSTPIYLQVKVNGVVATSNDGLEVAAFINGECRAVTHTYDANASNLLTLRVWGNPEEVGQTITFKVFDHYYGLLYSFSNTVEFTGETVEVPYVLNIDKPTAVVIDDPITITTKFPAEIDLTNYFKFDYMGLNSGDLVTYEPLGESTIETTLSYKWTTPDGGEFTAFSIDGNNILTATKETAAGGEEAKLTIKAPEANGTLCTGSTFINIIEQIVPVTSITCSINSVQMNKGESLYDKLTDAIVIAPADASNKSYYFEATDTPAAFENGVAMLGGSYQVKIISAYDSSIFTTITVDVTAPVEYVRVLQGTFQAALGDNILDLVTPHVIVGPDDATNKSFYLEVPAEASDAIVDNIAIEPGEFTLYVVSMENEQLKSEITVVITQIIAPESIDVDINTNAYVKLRAQVTITPEGEYTITPKDEESAAAFDENGNALKNGSFTLVVTSKTNTKVSKEVIVNVSTPVDITFPESLTISKYRDTEFELTITGDNFDPSLVTFEFTRDFYPQDFGIPTITNADDGAGKKWNIRGTGSGNSVLQVYYDGIQMPRYNAYNCEIQTLAEVAFNNDGWDWIYVPDNIELTDNGDNPAYLEFLNIDDNNKVIEIRSQTELLYNDKNYGFIGTIQSLNPLDGMYKIKAKYDDASNCVLSNNEGLWTRDISFRAKKGYTWIGYPNEWNITLDDFNLIDANTPSEGDRIIGKTNFAEYSNGEWVGSDFTFEVGKGYIYYNASEEINSISFDYTPDFSTQTYSSIHMSAKGQSKRNGSDVWNYDASQYADNMAIVAEIEGLENPEDYTIGAFVGDECRGMGKVVKDGKMMINVAGESGETVTFRLHNENTGEFIPLETEVRYSNGYGSLKSPLAITGASITGISEITTGENDEETYYDLYGRKVEGELSTGIYIVKTVKNGKVTVTKVSKK